jgi:D-glycero-alpha-D-manno-heptose-7-phosphate kinase
MRLPGERPVIITRAPLRISLGGGGTDLPSYYRDHGGFVISAAIDKYVYITLHETFTQELRIKYSQMELVERVDQVRHPIVREALRLVDVGPQPHLEIVSMSDIPAGTGLGSSGSFTVALLRALHAWKRNLIPRQDLAEQACRIEIDLLHEPVGKQDQYIASFGGITCFHFQTGGVEVAPLQVSSETLADLEDNLLLFFTGFTRSASAILEEQDTRTRRQDADMIAQLDVVKQLGCESKAALERGDLRHFAELMHVHWEHKKQRSQSMTNSQIDEYYELARRHGALGGKLIGAGGGGFLMLYTEDKTRLRHELRAAGLREVRMRFDFQGTTVVAQS